VSKPSTGRSSPTTVAEHEQKSAREGGRPRSHSGGIAGHRGRHPKLTIRGQAFGMVAVLPLPASRSNHVVNWSRIHLGESLGPGYAPDRHRIRYTSYVGPVGFRSPLPTHTRPLSQAYSGAPVSKNGAIRK